ncbi:unnamed protein product [Vitrella brassicaformis CCMP3155]|uniref:Uncharacterized protein n=2 Tax=Vitrella brassicaformis TaxID=1169539 RepID=A0A0G4ENZ6_VITBC|nr:unnamed protein product [Vitrella brassicaformis CCMP3155]|mmetsp:Transcript_53589/g.134853  ORF Transcript_53589/g.134853 Transcript_53589/m.134853 type:complete len:385 (+) Transcript_53589:112-1266(+)|eukprot:CEL99348.1 unnamed protein product [Vitrella brassicaformis CCMP3155]
MKRARTAASESSPSSPPPTRPLSVLHSIEEDLPVMCHRVRDLLGVRGCAALFAAAKTLPFTTEITHTVARRLDQLLREHHVDGVLTYEQHAQHQQGGLEQQDGGPGARRMTRRHYLIRVLWLVENGGDWAGNAVILRVARRTGHVTSLPVTITATDLRRLASKRRYLSRPEALQQYSVYCQDLGMGMELTPGANGDRLQTDLTLHTADTLPPACPFAATFDATDPACERLNALYRFFRELCIDKMITYPLDEKHCFARPEHPGSHTYGRISALLDQPLPVWGCRTVDHILDGGYKATRRIILSGDKADSTFAAFICLDKGKYFPGASLTLYTTERPQVGGEGPAGVFPQTFAALLEASGDASLLDTIAAAPIFPSCMEMNETTT